MSIISTVYIPEGIAMAADSRLTGTTKYPNGTIERHTLSDNSQKIFLICNGTIGISCCGDATIGGKSVGDFIREFEIDEVNQDDSINEVAFKLKDYTMNRHGEGVTYHICGYLGDSPYVYRVISGEIGRINISSAGEVNHGAIWNGQVIALRKIILGENPMEVNWNFMQLKDGIDFAEFMVDATIKYQRFSKGLPTCGGFIDVLVITKDYAKFIKHKILNP